MIQDDSTTVTTSKIHHYATKPGVRRCTVVAECRMHGLPIYMCSNATRCFRRNEVCNPYSQCPNASKVDKLFCAGRARENAFLAAKKKV